MEKYNNHNADIKIAFDVDGTLVSEFSEIPVEIEENVKLLKFFVQQGYDVYIWSQGGIDWCNEIIVTFDLHGIKVTDKGSFEPYVTFDNNIYENYGKINVKVKTE